MVENNLDIKNSFVVNKSDVLNMVEELELDEIIKENFLYLGEVESFWLDLVSLRLPFFILDMLEDSTIEIEYEKLLLIAKEVSEIIYKYSHRTFNTNLVENLSTMCKIYNFDNKDTSRVILSGYLCNIGLLKIPQTLLLKSDRLDELEYEIIKSAPYYTKEILSMIFGFDDITKLASNYCEKLDGSGYPYHLGGNELSLKDRLLIILYLYQSLSEARSYRKAFSTNDIFKILEDEVILGRIDSSVVNDLKAIF
jgi:HD-GYP domain-containing protein (c-di-GMP phosphodiesterase class II)